MFRKLRLFIVFSLVAAFLLTLVGCNNDKDNRIKIMTSTTLMTYVVEQVGGEHVQAINLVPPYQHPGNFDLKPSDVEALANASLFLVHGWPGETWVDNMVQSANNPDLEVIKVAVNGNWMIPQYQAEAVDKVLAALVTADPKHKEDYEKYARHFKARITAKESEVKNRLAAAGATGVNVIASARQADFLTWAGFDIVATFTSPAAMTPQVIADLIEKGKASSVKFIANNIQDGLDAGKPVADEVGIPNVNLSNFPGGYLDTDTWEKALDKNVSLLIAALK